MVSKLLVFGLCVAGMIGAQTITITSPTTSSTQSGTISLQVSLSSLPSASIVEYQLDGRRIGVATSSPFSYSYNTGWYVDDPSVSLVALARNATGTVLATSAAVPFAIQNHSGALTLTAPASFSNLSGTVTFSWTNTGYTRDCVPFVIDGIETLVCADSYGYDTTQLANGTHTFVIVAYPTTGNRSWGGGMAAGTFTTNNPTGTVQEIRGGSRDIWLQPGGTYTLSCTQVTVAGAKSSCTSPSFSSDNTAAATINSSSGLVTAVSNGAANLTISANGRTTTSRVIVRPSTAVPHFSKTGDLLTAYNASTSRWVSDVFNLIWSSDVSGNSTLQQEIIKSKINMHGSLYSNPVDSGAASLSAFQTALTNLHSAEIAFAQANDVSLYLAGDDVARNNNELYNSLNGSFSPQAIQYAMNYWKSSGVAQGVDMIDEVTSFWGSMPHATGKFGDSGFSNIVVSGGTATVNWNNEPIGNSTFSITGATNTCFNSSSIQAANAATNSFTFTTTCANGTYNVGTDANLLLNQWGTKTCSGSTICSPIIPNSAFTTLKTTINGSSSRLSIGWPAIGTASSTAKAGWSGDSAITDFMTFYWTGLSWRASFPWAHGVWENLSSMNQLIQSGYAVGLRETPLLVEIGMNGPFYTKQTSNTNYTPPLDQLQAPPVSPASVIAEATLSVILGAAGFRCYAYDFNQWQAERSGATIGQTDLQTGGSPSSTDSDTQSRWYAMAVASQLIHRLQPWIFGNQANSPDYGPSFYSTARASSYGNLLVLLNGVDASRTETVDLTNFNTGNTGSRYILTTSGIQVGSLSGNTDTITLNGGESVWYVFPASGVSAPAQPAQIGFKPTSVSGATSAILQWGNNAFHLTQQLSASVCGTACTVYLDKSLGPIYYRYSYLDSSNKVVAASNVQILN